MTVILCRKYNTVRFTTVADTVGEEGGNTSCSCSPQGSVLAIPVLGAVVYLSISNPGSSARAHQSMKLFMIHINSHPLLQYTPNCPRGSMHPYSVFYG